MSLRSVKKQQTRDGIVQATEQLLAERGFAATTMRDIAALAHLSYQTLYNYFPTKALIIQEILVRDVGEANTRALKVIGSYDNNLLSALTRLTEVRFSVIHKHDRSLWREVVVDTLRQQAQVMDVYYQIDSSARQLSVQLLQQAQRAGELQPKVDCELLARTLYGLGEFSLLEYILNDEISEADARKVIDAQTRLLVEPYLA